MEPGHRATTVILLLLAGVAMPAVGAGCGSSDRRPYVYESPLATQIAAFRREGPFGATRALDALTTFDWDTVLIFSEGASYRDIDRAIGVELFGRDGSFYDTKGRLLIFVRDGTVAFAQALQPPLIIDARSRTFTRDRAVLRARTPDPGPYAFELVEAPR